uniref:cryptochrome/photolyase family protein n=1 Tax=Flavobacterium sp. TaxID=239 RepID=UPI004048FDB7
MGKIKTLRLILGDQLNLQHSWYQNVDENVIYLMAEMKQETGYVKHHIQKIVAFFLSMREFSNQLKSDGHDVIYYKINESPEDLETLVNNTIQKHQITRFEYQEPDEYRLDLQLKNFCNTLAIPTSMVDSEHFYTTRNEVTDFFEGKKQFVMEYFYRYMRKKHDVLMVGAQPLGNQWNFDHDNREKYKGNPPIPFLNPFQKDIASIVTEIDKAGVSYFGSCNDHYFHWPTTRAEAFQILDFFCEKLLPYFGTYEDTAVKDEKFLFHSRLSFAMNSKILSPKEVVDQVVQYYFANSEAITISQVEGFVRQIIGWREYVRGIYWKEMPDYENLNTLENKNPLPDFYWTGKTKMRCMQQSISQSLTDAYAHHIQRLMILGNFALLTQTHPDEVDAWYLGVYIDAIEWVELPNTRGMSQFADGGIMATKPYVSSGAYINKMTNYCSNCHFKVKEKTGDKACPFNSLYWNFLDEKRSYFEKNQRMSMMLRLLDKMNLDDLAALKEKANHIIENPEVY